MSSLPISSSSSDAPVLAGAAPSADAVAPLLDVRCAVEFVLGTGTLTVRDCLRLERHTIIRLSQSAGADLSVLVHGIPVASGEVVIVDENTALRVGHILPPPGIEA